MVPLGSSDTRQPGLDALMIARAARLLVAAATAERRTHAALDAMLLEPTFETVTVLRGRPDALRLYGQARRRGRQIERVITTGVHLDSYVVPLTLVESVATSRKGVRDHWQGRAVVAEPLVHGAACEGVIYAERRASTGFDVGHSRYVEVIAALLSGLDRPAVGDEQLYDEQLRDAPDEGLEGLGNLLEHSRLGGAHVDLQHVDFDPSSVLRDLFQPMASRAHAKGLAAKLSLPTQLPQLRGDATLLAVATRQLLRSAVDHTHTGEVRIRAWCEPLTHSDARSAGRARLFVEIADAASGLGPDALRALFSPLADDGPARAGRLGLGLSLTRRIARRLGGSLTVDSDANGNTFTLTTLHQIVG